MHSVQVSKSSRHEKESARKASAFSVKPKVFGSGPVGPHSVLDKCVPGYYLRRSTSDFFSTVLRGVFWKGGWNWIIEFIRFIIHHDGYYKRIHPTPTAPWKWGNPRPSIHHDVLAKRFIISFMTCPPQHPFPKQLTICRSQVKMDMWKIPLACDLAFHMWKTSLESSVVVFFAQVKEMQQLLMEEIPNNHVGWIKTLKIVG